MKTKEKKLDLSTDQLVSDYLDLCNQILRDNNDFLVRMAKRLNEIIWDEPKFEVVVYDQRPDDTLGKFNIQYKAKEQRIHQLSSGYHDTIFTWRVPRSYLEKVLSHPEYYKAKPTKLDWKWMTERAKKSTREEVAGGSGLMMLGAALGALGLYFWKGRSS